MGQEERKNKAKLEKTQITVAATNTEYENAVKALEDTTARWNREWKAAADKFQDLEEERLDFSKSSLWTFANISSTVCVSDDASCEKIRLSLETMDVEDDIMHFISERGTGQEIPDPPKYINFCKGDVEDPQPEPVEEDNYSVAQFPRSINPQFRSSSPQPSTFESHHDPNSALARDLSHNDPPAPPNQEPAFPASREPTFPPHKAAAPVVPPQNRHQPHDRHPGNAMQPYEPHHDPTPPFARDRGHHNLAKLSSREAAQPVQRAPAAPMPPQDRRQGNGGQQYETGQFAEVPHDPYPMDGMTMLCRTDGMNSATSSNLSARPSSRDDNSDYSNPTSLSSQEPPSGKVSPVKQEPVIEAQPDKRVLKKKSGFFQNHSPFRRKSVKEVQQSNRNTWGPTSSTQNGPTSRRPQHSYQPSEPRNVLADRTASPEPIDANASLALNVGQNVFPVATPDARKKSTDSGAPQEEKDPIALALAELKEVAGNKHSAGRISADHYHGIATPVPDRAAERPQSQVFSRPVPLTSKSTSDVAAATRGTPPPSYDQQVSRLGVPPPAVTSRAMQESSRKYTDQTREMFKPSQPTSRPYASTPTRPTTRGADVPRATSPAPPRSLSPRPGTSAETRQQPRSASPNPYSSGTQKQAQRAPSPNPYTASQIPAQKPAAPSTYSHNQMQKALPSSSYSSTPRQTQRAPSPNPYSASASQKQTQEAASPRSSFNANRTPTQKAAPSSSYGASQSRAQKTASPNTFTGNQRQAQESTSPNPYSAGQAQTPTQKSTASSYGMPKTASPSTYTPSQRKAQGSASPNPYSGGQSNVQKPAASPSSYTPSQRQAPASPNPYSGSQRQAPASPNPYNGSQRQSQSQAQAQRSVSPNPYAGSPRQAHRSVSPNPYAGSQHRNSASSQRGATPTRGSGSEQAYFRGSSPGDAAARAASPSVYRGDYGRPDSRDSRNGGADMAIQLAPVGGDPYGSMRSSRSGGGGAPAAAGGRRPGTSSSSRTAFGASGGSNGGGGGGAMTFYDGRDPMQEGSRQRSQSVADPSRQYTPDGRAILHYGKSIRMENPP